MGTGLIRLGLAACCRGRCWIFVLKMTSFPLTLKECFKKCWVCSSPNPLTGGSGRLVNNTAPQILIPVPIYLKCSTTWLLSISCVCYMESAWKWWNCLWRPPRSLLPFGNMQTDAQTPMKSPLLVGLENWGKRQVQTCQACTQALPLLLPSLIPSLFHLLSPPPHPPTLSLHFPPSP